MLPSNHFVAKNERIIAQDLAEIKDAIQSHDSTRILELGEILAKEIKKYPVKPDVVNRLETVSDYSDTFSSAESIEEKIQEIDELIDILISSR